MKTCYSILILIAISCTAVHAGTAKADRLFDRWEYYRAAQLYEREVKKNPGADVYYKLGECYRKMNRYKQAAAAYDQVNAEGTYHNPDFYLHYGQVLNNNGRFDDAKVAYDKYSTMKPDDKTAEHYKEAIAIVEEDHKWDEPIEVHNMKAVNTETADFAPVLYRNGVVFASSRKTPGHTLIYPWTGSNYLDLYYASNSSDGIDLSNAVPFGGETINQRYHDGPATFSADFNTMYFSRVEVQKKGKFKTKDAVCQNKIYMSRFENEAWTEPEPFEYNSDEYSVANPYLSRDGKRLYFVSDMSGGYGATDIYYCDRDGDTWGRPINLGPSVNTFGTEKFPNEDTAGNFYFASDGYQGFGGLDICVARKKGGKLEKAVPMKYPFNSPTDDFGIAFTKEGRAGYFSTNRYDGGTGDDDLYFFDLDRDNVDTNLTTDVYVIGYRPPMPPIASIQPKDSTLDVRPEMLAVYHGNIYFDFDKSDLRPEAKQALDTLANFMNSNPNKTLVLGGHADSRGSASYNQKLSQRRNEAAMRYLSAKGISRSRIKATGYGFTRVINGCTKEVPCNEDQHQLNRRVEYGFE
jgi:peptidoglycan-associated lipoprotein